MEAAEAAGVSGRTARKWLGRYRAEGLGGLTDRSSRPLRQPPVRREQRAVLEHDVPGCGEGARSAANGVCDCMQPPDLVGHIRTSDNEGVVRCWSGLIGHAVHHAEPV